MIKALIFDMDGTLLNTLEDLADSVNHVLKELGHPTHPYERYRKIVGAGARDHVKRALPTHLQNDDQYIDHAFKLYVETYGNNWKNKTALYDGISDLLDILNEKDLKLAIVSNKPHQFLTKVFHHFFPKWHFDHHLGAIDGTPKKPHPQMVENVLKILNINKEDALYIGDSDIDIHTAQNAHMTSVGCLWGFRGEEELKNAGANYLISTPLELLDIINKNS